LREADIGFTLQGGSLNVGDTGLTGSVRSWDREPLMMLD